MMACTQQPETATTSQPQAVPQTPTSMKIVENIALTPQKQSLAVIANLEAKGDLANLSVAINMGLDNGLTVNQIKEALSQLYAYTGFPKSLNALGTLQAVIEARQTEGKQTEIGNDASPLSSDYDALKQGTEVQTKLSGAPFNYTFAPATDYYLKAHLFGDIFARDVLTYDEREIVTVAALSGIEGVHPQLKSHVNGARNMGVTDDEIHAIPAVLSACVGDVEAFRAKKAIAEVYGEKFAEGKPVENMIFPKGEFNAAYAQYFVGNSYLAPLNSDYLGISNVTFEPGCRNNWHVHHDGSQILICVGGEGWYQEWDKPAQRLKPGDIVAIPPEVKHWHGATKGSWFQHLATHVQTGDNPSNEWLEPVTDDVYDKLPE